MRNRCCKIVCATEKCIQAWTSVKGDRTKNGWVGGQQWSVYHVRENIRFHGRSIIFHLPHVQSRGPNGD